MDNPLRDKPENFRLVAGLHNQTNLEDTQAMGIQEIIRVSNDTTYNGIKAHAIVPRQTS